MGSVFIPGLACKATLGLSLTTSVVKSFICIMFIRLTARQVSKSFSFIIDGINCISQYLVDSTLVDFIPERKLLKSSFNLVHVGLLERRKILQMIKQIIHFVKNTMLILKHCLYILKCESLDGFQIYEFIFDFTKTVHLYLMCTIY